MCPAFLQSFFFVSSGLRATIIVVRLPKIGNGCSDLTVHFYEDK